MRNFNYLMMLTALVGFAAFTACERNANPETSQSSAVKFTGERNDMTKTRAADQTWAAGDQIGVFMVRGANPVVVDAATNRQYTTTDGNGTFTPVITTEPASNSTIYYPVDGNDVNFIAYYPYNAAITTLGDYPVTIPTDQNPTGNPAAEVQPTFDLLYAVANSNADDEEIPHYNKGTKTPVAFQFQHKLSKVVFNIVHPTDETGVARTYFADMKVEMIELNNTTTFNLQTGLFGDITTTTSSTIARQVSVWDGNGQEPAYAATYDAIIVPQPYLRPLEVQFVITSETADDPVAGTYRLTLTNPTFVSGSVHTYNVTVTRTDVTITNTTITDWTSGGTTPVTAE